MNTDPLTVDEEGFWPNNPISFESEIRLDAHHGLFSGDTEDAGGENGRTDSPLWGGS